MESKDQRVGKMEKQLSDWGARIDELANRASTAGAKAVEKEQVHVAELRAKRGALEAKLIELKAAGKESWSTLKKGVDSAYEELEVAFKKATK